MIEVRLQVHMTEAEAARGEAFPSFGDSEMAGGAGGEESRGGEGRRAVMDEDFARDIEEGLQASREPWNPPSWD